MLKAFDDGFNRQAQQNAELSEANENLNVRIRQKIVVINELKDVLKSSPATAPTPPAPIHSRRISSDPVKFNGEESDMTKRQQSYVNWKTQLRVFFVQDSSVFNIERIKLLHIFGLLGGDAYENNRLYFEQFIANPEDSSTWKLKTADQLFMSLDSQYETVNLKLDASIKYDKLYQRKTPFPNFIATFQSLATRCGKTEEQKVEALKRKVADEIAQQFRSLDRPPASDYFSGWVAKGSRFYENIQEYEHNLKTKGEGNRPYQNQFDKNSSSGKSTFTVSQGGDEMDLDQVTLFKLTEKEKNICREHNLCFYCREQGHSIGECDRKWVSENKVSYRDSSGSQ